MSHKLRATLLVAAAGCLLLVAAPAVPAGNVDVAGSPSAKVPCKKAKQKSKKARGCGPRQKSTSNTPPFHSSANGTSNVPPIPLECLEAVARGEWNYC